jgi:hypothetical protein
LQSLDDGSLQARLRALEARRTRAEAELLALRWGIGMGIVHVWADQQI